MRPCFSFTLRSFSIPYRALRQAIKTIANKLKKGGFQTVLVVPPSGGQKYVHDETSRSPTFFLPTFLSLFRFIHFFIACPVGYGVKILRSSRKASRHSAWWPTTIRRLIRGPFGDTFTDTLISKKCLRLRSRVFRVWISFSCSGGPIAPLKWVSDSIESIVPVAKEKSKRKKLLLGLNHYGYDWSRTKGAEAILSSTYVIGHSELKKKLLPSISTEIGSLFVDIWSNWKNIIRLSCGMKNTRNTPTNTSSSSLLSLFSLLSLLRPIHISMDGFCFHFAVRRG